METYRKQIVSEVLHKNYQPTTPDNPFPTSYGLVPSKYEKCRLAFFVQTDYAWKKWQIEPPMCRCSKREETAECFFQPRGKTTTSDLKTRESLDLLDLEDCKTFVTTSSN